MIGKKKNGTLLGTPKKLPKTFFWLSMSRKRRTCNEEYEDVVIDENIFNDYEREPEVKAQVVHLTDDYANTDVGDTSAIDAPYDEPQDHENNEIVRVSHHGASEGVEHINTAAEQISSTLGINTSPPTASRLLCLQDDSARKR